MIFTYLFTVNVYDITVTIEFFPHIVGLKDSPPKLTNEVANSWRFILFYLTLPLGYFLQKHLTVGSFSTETFYCWVISYGMLFNCVNVSAVGIVYGLILSIPI